MGFSAALLTLAAAVLWLGAVQSSDVTVQVHINRPLNDISDKFVSFSIRPEDLVGALDGPKRKSVTRMATLLGDSYIKFVGDFYFASGAASTPSQIFWKGFNSWTRAVNWTMVIPVPYAPQSWNRRQALNILKAAYNIGVKECIWQLGTDFSSSSAQNYVSELRTFDSMVDSFRPLVDDWKVMGADISAGSSVQETRRYVELSSELNSAFGWAQAPVAASTTQLNNYVDVSDAALQVLLEKEVPVWLSLPAAVSTLTTQKSDELNEAFRWATSLGEAAALGFDVVFKRVTASDLQRPSFSVYVTALFKRVMGARVFPARPLHVPLKTSKLYTHCARGVSGGIAFMLVNADARPLHISVRSASKAVGSAVWTYSLQQQRGVTLLNDEPLALNSSLQHRTSVHHPNAPIELITAGLSVSFWVLPNADLDHCHFATIDESNEIRSATSGGRVVEKRFSSKASSSGGVRKQRKPRPMMEKPATSFVFGERLKKFFGNPFAEEKKTLQRRANERSQTFREAALSWLQQLLPDAPQPPLLKRGARKADDGALGKLGKKKVITRRLTGIKKLGKKSKAISNADEFDEEEYFNHLGAQQEPEYRFPEGDDMDDIQTEKVNVELHPGMSFRDAFPSNAFESQAEKDVDLSAFKLPTQTHNSLCCGNPQTGEQQRLPDVAQQAEDFLQQQREQRQPFFDDVYPEKPLDGFSMQNEAQNLNNYFDAAQHDDRNAFQGEYSDPLWDVSRFPKTRAMRSAKLADCTELDESSVIDKRSNKHGEESSTEKSVEAATSTSTSPSGNDDENISSANMEIVGSQLS